MSLDEFHFKTPNTMFRSFFKVALRILMRDRVHTLVNISGLAIGLAFSIIIFLYVHQEISYDSFHKQADRIYRIGVKGKISDNVFNHALTPAPLARTLLRESPEVESAVRVARFGAWLVQYGSIRNNEDNLIFADSAFFSMFSFPLVRGKAEEVLRYPRSIVLSESEAWTYFGAEDPIGKQLRIENDSTYYTVTGIMEDIPQNSHMHFDMVGSIRTFDAKLLDDRWIVHYLYTYVKVRSGMSADSLNHSLQRLVGRYVMPDYARFLAVTDDSLQAPGSFTFLLQPIRKIHLRSNLTAEFEPVGNILYIYLFTALGIAIMVLSCINFIMLTTARSTERAKEVSIRKIAGSERHILVRQFLIESSLLAFFSMALALFISELCLPAFNRYMDLDLRLSQLLNSSGIILLIALILIIGLVSGLYPALHYSSVDPLTLIHAKPKNTGHRRFRLFLVLFQLFVGIGVITLTGIVVGQYRYLIRKDLGFDRENLLVIRRPDGLRDRLEDYKQLIRNHPGVVSVTNSTSIPGSSFSRHPYYMEGTSAARNYAAANVLVSYDFDSVYRIKLKEGRFFEPAIQEDSTACVINETMARLLGGGNLVGRKLIQPTDKPGKRYAFTIIGVVDDFNYETLERPVFPMVMLLMPGNFEGYLTVRLDGEPVENIAFLKDAWERYTSAYPFVSYFLDDNLREQYQPIRETGRIFTLLSLVTLLIACLGLFGLVSYTYSRKGTEIGIRKALGAAPENIILQEVGRIFTFLLISSLLSWIGVYFLAQSWLLDYAHRIPLLPVYFLAPFGIILLIALLSVLYRSWLAASANPGRALHYE